MENGRGKELAGQNPRIQYTNTKNRIPRSGQFQEQGYQSVPNWEKKFCTSICKISWKQICDTQNITYLYPKIDKWDDSGAKEAFDNGKARYWAEINGLPCDIPWPSPDEYIDSIDHNAKIDPELLEDLYKVPETTSEENYTYQTVDQYFNIEPTGWGDEIIKSEYNNDEVIQPTGWGYENEQAPELNNVYQFLEEEPNQWIERKKSSNKMNSADNYGGFKGNRDYNCSKKESGSKRSKGWKKASHAVNPSVNWKAQRESPWQRQKSVVNNGETGGGSNIGWDSYQPAVDTAPGTGGGSIIGRDSYQPGWDSYEPAWDSYQPAVDTAPGTGGGSIIGRDSYQPGWDSYQPGWDSYQPAVDTAPGTGWGEDEEKYDNHAIYTDTTDRYSDIKPTGWGYEDERAPELSNVDRFPEKQSNQWIERKNSRKKTNSTDRYGGFQVNSDYDYSKKEFGSKRDKGRKKAFYATNPSVNWKTQRESSWQWQKVVF